MTKTQLEHPEGKHAVRMDLAKYEPIKDAIFEALDSNSPLSRTELLHSIKQYFTEKK